MTISKEPTDMGPIEVIMSIRRRRRFSVEEKRLLMEVGAFMVALAAIFSLCVAIALQSPVWAQSDLTHVNLKIAFIGDQGLGPNAEAVLNLIKNEGASAVLHQGDFDYVDNPAGWDGQINRILGPNFPYFALVGNHDAARFYGSGGYQEFLAARMNRLGIPWEGDLGVQSSFHYEGIFIVQTAPGIFGTNHDLYIRDQLAADNSIWRISSWHKNMRLMQVGGKSDETGWGVYEESRAGGAIIATGHEHSYSRTHLLSNFVSQTVAGTGDTLVLASDDPNTLPDEGRSFAFVSGLGGIEIRTQQLSGNWWASIYTSNQGANFGALFGVFNHQGDPRLAYFYFKDIDGNVPDDFFVQSSVGVGDGVTVTVNGAGGGGGGCSVASNRGSTDYSAAGSIVLLLLTIIILRIRRVSPKVIQITRPE